MPPRATSLLSAVALLATAVLVCADQLPRQTQGAAPWPIIGHDSASSFAAPSYVASFPSYNVMDVKWDLANGDQLYSLAPDSISTFAALPNGTYVSNSISLQTGESISSWSLTVRDTQFLSFGTEPNTIYVYGCSDGPSVVISGYSMPSGASSFSFDLALPCNASGVPSNGLGIAYNSFANAMDVTYFDPSSTSWRALRVSVASSSFLWNVSLNIPGASVLPVGALANTASDMIVRSSPSGLLVRLNALTGAYVQAATTVGAFVTATDSYVISIADSYLSIIGATNYSLLAYSGGPTSLAAHAITINNQTGVAYLAVAYSGSREVVLYDLALRKAINTARFDAEVSQIVSVGSTLLVLNGKSLTQWNYLNSKSEFYDLTEAYNGVSSNFIVDNAGRIIYRTESGVRAHTGSNKQPPNGLSRRTFWIIVGVSGGLSLMSTAGMISWVIVRRMNPNSAYSVIQ